MKNRFDSVALRVPDELRSLDAELSSIRYEERPSFGPELQAELSQEWDRLESRRRTSFRPFPAAVLVALLLMTAAVPSARASLVRLIGAFQSDEADSADVPAEVQLAEPDPTQVVAGSPIVEEVVTAAAIEKTRRFARKAARRSIEAQAGRSLGLFSRYHGCSSPVGQGG